jgi:hypothetical protein
VLILPEQIFNSMTIISAMAATRSVLFSQRRRKGKDAAVQISGRNRGTHAALIGLTKDWAECTRGTEAIISP